jgi:hypothetical protein
MFFQADDGQILAVFGPQRIPRLDFQREDTGQYETADRVTAVKS